MQQYLEILQEILDKGTWKKPSRENMPRTIERFSIEKRFDLQNGFPLLTTKKISWENVLHELLWFLRGDTNIKYLVDHGCNIWNEDAYKYYLKFAEKNGDSYQNSILSKNLDGSYKVFSLLEFIETIKLSSVLPKWNYQNYTLGDLGPTYGKQWRRWNKPEFIHPYNSDNGFDQIQRLIDEIKKNPESRYHVVTAWNPSEVFTTALPTCHILFQMSCREMDAMERTDTIDINSELYQKYKEVAPKTGEMWSKWLDIQGVPQYYLDCKLIQRSCDTFLGVPYNIASYAFLTHIIAKLTNTIPGEFIWSGNSVHLYENHLEQVNLQLSREPKTLPQLNIKGDWKSIDDVKFEDFEITGYDPHPFIKAELSTGLKR